MLRFFIITIFTASILVSCASLHAYSIVLSSYYDGKIVIENEKNVIAFMKNIINSDIENYSIRAFNRKAISHLVKKTPDTTHSFFVIYNKADNTYNTLSFSATSKWATSRGAWAMNTEPDLLSYFNYITDNNNWEVQEIVLENGIDTSATINNILEKTQKKIKYFFRSKYDKNNKYDNCNTALLETLTGNDLKKTEE